MKIYKHLFFDLDHTLWDFETNAMEAMKNVFNIHHLDIKIENLPFQDFYNRYSFHNHRLWDRYTKGFIKQDELKWKRMWLSLLDFKIADKDLALKMSDDFLNLLPSQNKVFPFTHELLQYLQSKDYHLHLITNGFIKTQMQKLLNSNLHSYFEAIITSEESGSLKPQKEIFAYALKKTGANLKESIMIGDNIEADINGAMQFGMDCVFVNHISVTSKVKATYTVQDLKSLLDIF